MLSAPPFLHLGRKIRSLIPASRIFTDPLYTLAKGTDASFYRLVPGMVVRVENEAEVIHVIRCCSESLIPVTFKAGGTSLSGQTVTDSVLVEIGDRFTGFHATDNGRLVDLQCGITGGLANVRLSGYGRRIGPDPASINSAKIGGIVSNNASGGAFGISNNSYNTLHGMRIIFADGTLLDTRDRDSCKLFSENHAGMLEKLQHLSYRVKSDPVLSKRIRHKYEIKNTCGYGVNALLDFDDPFDIISHLMVGSEGTLGFISEVTLATVEDFPLKATSLIFFPSVRHVCEVIGRLKDCSIAAAELMDRNALRSVQNNPGMPEDLKTLPEETAALLIDTGAHTQEILDSQVNKILSVLSGIQTILPVNFNTDPVLYEKLWKVRKGLFTSAAATRPAGAACIIEDLTFRPEVLADALADLRALLIKYGYTDSVIWGHIMDGNIHFVIMPDFQKTGSLKHYSRFMQEIVQLTVHRYDGSLKGEHGTGRNMAPFVREEWGDELYQVMHEIKKIFDPENLLNPGVILNDDPEVHLRNIKSFPVADETIDSCIECGFCESNCPSRSITLTPRGRIVVFRELIRLSSTGNYNSTYSYLRKKFRYDGDATCATDGLCALTCPVEINTGKLIKDLRFIHNSRFSNAVADFAAGHMKLVTGVVRKLLTLVGIFHRLSGTRIMSFISIRLHRYSGRKIPLWNPYMPLGTQPVIATTTGNNRPEQVVYFPACINRAMGKSADYGREPALVHKTAGLLGKAGFDVLYPENLADLCCGMAFSSKGFKKQAGMKARELEAALLKVSDNGRIPVYCDMSPCLLTMKETLDTRLKLFEPVEFILRYFPGRLAFRQVPRTVALHSTCSNTRMGLDKKLAVLAGMCAREVIVPDDVGCCGWAGDRGFTHPELNASALKSLKSQLRPDIQQGYSSSRTCEIGLSQHSGISYKSIVYLVDEATDPI
ncbi:MAG TPA: FAD-binding and (Fe-S)-binding domain-containing protein [Bacteroidales bacterium]|nr:FAD-binding and (Fe-S)-binding domain-containing protein [Bacteroidales bacterium]